MITRRQRDEARDRAIDLLRSAHVAFGSHEVAQIEVADFGLSRLFIEGAQILTLAQTARYSAKIVVLLAGQTLPEHWHPPIGNDPGKDETVRVHWGELFLGIPGTCESGAVNVPPGKEQWYTSRCVLQLRPGDSYHVPPGTRHWFQAGTHGTVLFSFSSTVRDARDRFSDPDVVRNTVLSDSGP